MLDKLRLLLQNEDLELDDDINDDDKLHACGFTLMNSPCGNDTVKCSTALFAPATGDIAEGGFVCKGRKKWFKVFRVPDVIPVAVTPAQVLHELGTRPFWALQTNRRSPSPRPGKEGPERDASPSSDAVDVVAVVDGGATTAADTSDNYCVIQWSPFSAK